MSPISRSFPALSCRRSIGSSVSSQTAMPHPNRWSCRSIWTRLSCFKRSNRPRSLVVLKEPEGGTIVSSTATVSNTTAPTQFITAGDNKYAYRQFGSGPGLPLLFLQHFTGTLDGWDPAVTGSLALRRSVILFDIARNGPAYRQVRTIAA